MDLENTTYEDLLAAMCDKSAEFDVHLCRIKKVNDELIGKTQKAVEALGKLTEAVRRTDIKKCSVCYTRERTMCLVPCGHVFCSNCGDRARSRDPPRCFTCRARIVDTLRIYV